MLLSSMTMAGLRVMSSDSILRGSEALILSLEPGRPLPCFEASVREGPRTVGEGKG